MLLLDLAIDLLIPPLSIVALAVLAGLAASRLGAPWLLCALFLLLYVVRGWTLSGTGAQGLAALLRAPFYVLWKFAALARGPEGWVRTPREEAAV